jgi:hypothetical protein
MQTIKLYKNTVEIEFDEERHIFKRNGETLISVTAATSQIDKSQALVPWAINLMRDFLIAKWDPKKKISEEEKMRLIMEASQQHRMVKEREATIGDLAHDWASQWIKGKKPEIPEEDRLRNCVISFLNWVKESKIKFEMTEKVVYSKRYNYAGILDAAGKIDGERVILDFKATNAIYSEMRYQLAGYWQALEEETKKQYKRGYIVKFGKDTGEFQVLEIPRGEYKKDLKAFLGALAIKRREKEIGQIKL